MSRLRSWGRFRVIWKPWILECMEYTFLEVLNLSTFLRWLISLLERLQDLQIDRLTSKCIIILVGLIVDNAKPMITRRQQFREYFTCHCKRLGSPAFKGASIISFWPSSWFQLNCYTHVNAGELMFDWIDTPVPSAQLMWAVTFKSRVLSEVCHSS